MAPRPLTSIFMAPPPPSRPTASGGQSGPGPTTPTFHPAFPGLPVTALPEGGISIVVPSSNELEPEPVWRPKARLALAKTGVWDGMAPFIPSSNPALSNTNSRPLSSGTHRPPVPKPRVQQPQVGTDALSDPNHPRKRHVPRNPLDPHRLALISNALGVSMPLPPRAVLENRVLEDRVRKSSLDDVRLAQNHARTSSLASFRSGPTPMRSATSLSVSRQLVSSASSISTFPVVATPSQPTRFLLHVYPPPHMPSVHPFASRSPPPGYHSQFRRGTLVALHASLPGQLSAIAKEYGLPSTSGMCVYLLGADYEPPEEEDEDVPPQRGDERALGPRIGEEPWKMLWAALLKADRDEMMRSYNPNEVNSVTGSPASGLAPLGAEEYPPPEGPMLSHKSSVSSFAPRPLKTVAAIKDKDSFKSIPFGATSPSGTASTVLSRNPSLATTQSRTSSPTTTVSSSKINIMPALPIVGKIEFDIDMRRAPWYETFCNRAHQQMAQRRLPSRVATPTGVLATPAPRSRSPSPVTLTLPPRARSVSPAPGGDAILFPPRSASPSSSKFPMHLQLPSNPANRTDRGLLSPKDAMFSTPLSSDEEPTSPSLGLGLHLSPSSSTVADGMMMDVIPEGGYTALSDDEQDQELLRAGQDPLGDVFPEDETWDTSTRAIKGIEDLPLPEDDEDDLTPSDPAAEVVQLWNEHNRPGISLAPPPPAAKFARPSDPSAVVFPKPAPARQRSESIKRPPPLKLEEQEETKEEQGQTEIVVTGEDGEDWNWRSSEHVRKERLDELEKALAQLSPRILEPPPPEFERPRSPGLHHRMFSGGTLRAGAARPDPHAPLFMSEELSSLKASMAAKSGSSTPTTPRTPRTPPMTSESRIRMQNEHKLDLTNLPPPGTAPPRPRRPQTPVALNSPPFEESPPVPNHQRSRFSMDSNGEEAVAGLAAPNRERANSIMSVKGIKKLWRGRNSTQNLNGLANGTNRDSQLPVNPAGQHKRDSSNSAKDPFHFDQELIKDKEGKPATKSILKKWSSKPNDPRLSPKGANSQSARGSISSVNTLTNGGLQAIESGRPSVSSSLASDGEPMTPRMSQFEMVVPNGQQS
ncbi:unnamed protein product [Rhizoctonia solani]|uniref:Uncharacterized protein n=1 Tax=Rhizoctonia solani TaxID=456999 RepID=A0A8H3C093_9AGAM|nr:unnamed protein product [Rhizoctonia solani]CAE6519927.1 unnamed protein product [Rhizoctonia solani]